MPVVGRREVESTAAELGLHESVQAAEDEQLPGEGALRSWLHGPKRYAQVLRQVVEAMAASGSLILVGCGAVEILRKRQDAFHLLLVARREDRVRRAEEGMGVSRDVAEKLVRESDEHRSSFHRQLFGARWDEPHRYHLTLNTSMLSAEQAARLVLCCLDAMGGTELPPGAWKEAVGAVPAPWQHVTISREFGAMGRELGEQLAAAMGWRCWDDELMHRSAALEGIPVPDLIRVDERGPGFLERLSRLQESARYFQGLKEAMEDATSSPSVIVGRGGNMLVPPDKALHLRLVAEFGDRLEWVMRHHWLSEGAARERISEQDALRAAFHRHYFRVDWADPLVYHAVFNVSRLAPSQVVRAVATFLQESQAGAEQ